jgi:hypothetical protein
MREVTEKAIKAFLNGKNCKLGGTCNNQYAGIGYGQINTEIDNGGLYLFGNCIAKLVNEELYVRICVNSSTTRERLNGFSSFGYKISVTQHKFEPYINGEQVHDYTKWYHIQKV